MTSSTRLTMETHTNLGLDENGEEVSNSCYKENMHHVYKSPLSLHVEHHKQGSTVWVCRSPDSNGEVQHCNESVDKDNDGDGEPIDKLSNDQTPEYNVRVKLSGQTGFADFFHSNRFYQLRTGDEVWIGDRTKLVISGTDGSYEQVKGVNTTPRGGSNDQRDPLTRNIQHLAKTVQVKHHVLSDPRRVSSDSHCMIGGNDFMSHRENLVKVPTPDELLDSIIGCNYEEDCSPSDFLKFGDTSAVICDSMSTNQEMEQNGNNNNIYSFSEEIDTVMPESEFNGDEIKNHDLSVHGDGSCELGIESRDIKLIREGSGMEVENIDDQCGNKFTSKYLNHSTDTIDKPKEVDHYGTEDKEMSWSAEEIPGDIIHPSLESSNAQNERHSVEEGLCDPDIPCSVSDGLGSAVVGNLTPSTYSQIISHPNIDIDDVLRSLETDYGFPPYPGEHTEAKSQEGVSNGIFDLPPNYTCPEIQYHSGTIDVIDGRWKSENLKSQDDKSGDVDFTPKPILSESGSPASRHNYMSSSISTETQEQELYPGADLEKDSIVKDQEEISLQIKGEKPTVRHKDRKTSEKRTRGSAPMASKKRRPVLKADSVKDVQTSLSDKNHLIVEASIDVIEGESKTNFDEEISTNNNIISPKSSNGIRLYISGTIIGSPIMNSLKKLHCVQIKNLPSVESMCTANHSFPPFILVMSKLKRTETTLLAIIFGCPIVSPETLKCLAKTTGESLSEDEVLRHFLESKNWLNDLEAEKKWAFSLEKSIQSVRDKRQQTETPLGILSGYDFLITDKKTVPEEFKRLAIASGAKITEIYESDAIDNYLHVEGIVESSIFPIVEKTPLKARESNRLKAVNIKKVYSVDTFLTAILTQSVERIEAYVL